MKSLYTHALCTCLAVLITSNAWAQNPTPTTDTAPQNTQVSKEKLIQAYQDKQWQESIQLANELLKIEPQNADILSIQGVAFANLGQYEDALKVFEQALKNQPEDKQLKTSLCGVKNNLKHPQTLEACLEAAKSNPENGELQHLTGTLLEAEKKYTEARAHYEAALKAVPDSAVYFTSITSLDFKLGNYAKALEMSEKAIQGPFEKNPIIWINLLIAANRSSAYEKTIEYGTKGYEIFHDHYLLAERAEAYFALGQFENAEKDLNLVLPRLTKGLPGTAKTQYIYAKTLLALSCNQETQKTCETAQKDACCGREAQALTILQSLQGDKSLKVSDFSVFLGHAQILNNQLDAAEALLTKATSQQMDKDNASALAALAVALYRFNDNRDKAAALRFYQQAVEASPDFSDPQKVRNSRGWAPSLVQTLTQIQADAKAQADSKNKKSGCSCDITAKHHSFPLMTAILAIFMSIGFLATRKKAN